MRRKRNHHHNHRVVNVVAAVAAGVELSLLGGRRATSSILGALARRGQLSREWHCKWHADCVRLLYAAAVARRTMVDWAASLGCCWHQVRELWPPHTRSVQVQWQPHTKDRFHHAASMASPRKQCAEKPLQRHLCAGRTGRTGRTGRAGRARPGRADHNNAATVIPGAPFQHNLCAAQIDPSAVIGVTHTSACISGPLQVRRGPRRVPVSGA